MRNKKFVKHTSRAFAILMSAMMAVGLAMPVSAAEKKETKEDKTETVYVNANADGSVDKITVSDWLKNHGSSDKLEDYSNLENIKNVKGDETFTQNEDGSIVWDSKGNDIYYQGESNEELPVSMKVTYYLDGKKMDPKDMAGKSGNVKIRFDYYNNSSETVKVKGKNYNVKTPFTMVTGMILSSDVFSNIEVTNGKVISDGDKNVVVGLAFPGLKSSLNLASYDKLQDVDIPEYVEVTAKADKFELALTATAATTGTLKDIDTSDLNDVDDLKEDMDKLTDATDKLIDGSEALSDGMGTLSSSAGEYTKGVSSANSGVKQLVAGLNTLNSKSGQLESGVESLNKGLKALKKGTKALNSGISSYTKGVSSLDAGLQSAASGTDKLEEGAGALSKGITSYTEGASNLASGISQLNSKVSGMSNLKLPSDAELKAVKEASNALESDAKALKESASEIESAIEKVNKLSAAVEAHNSKIESHNKEVSEKFNNAKSALDDVDSKASSQANEQLESKKSSINSEATSKAKSQAESAIDSVNMDGLTDEMKSALKSAVDSQIDVSVDTGSISISGAASDAKAALGDKPADLDKLDVGTINVSLDSMEALLKDMQKQATILEQFASNTAALSDAAGQIPALIKGVNELNNGAKALTANNKTLTSGMKELTSGLGSLSSGLDAMTQGAATLTGNSSALVKGASSVDTGTGKLVAGSDQLVTGVKAYAQGVNAAATGIQSLSSGMNKLDSAGGQLTSGIDKLATGSDTLTKGLKTFNDDGISKLSDLAGDDLDSVINHFKAVKKADKRYKSFGGIKKNAEGSVKFVIETDPIETEDE